MATLTVALHPRDQICMHPFTKYEKIEKNLQKPAKSCKKSHVSARFRTFRILLSTLSHTACVFDRAFSPIFVHVLTPPYCPFYQKRTPYSCPDLHLCAVFSLFRPTFLLKTSGPVLLCTGPEYQVKSSDSADYSGAGQSFFSSHFFINSA